MDHHDIGRHEKLARQLAKLLAGQPPALQGAVLADLMATWLEGHVVEGNSAETDSGRERLLALQVKTIRSLLELSD